MAEDMVGVEEHVQRSYEEEHIRANEYLRTAKNLGAPRQASQSNQSTKIEPLPISQKESRESSEYMQPMSNKNIPSAEYTDVNFGAKTLNQANAEAQDHDTHNSAIEAMKEQLRNTRIIPLEDMEQPKQPVNAQSLLDTVSEDDASLDSSNNLEAPQKESSTDKAESSPEEAVVDDAVVEDEKLDTQKLVEMMEEDGKLEEHTRQITEKPKDVKPKEAYPENDIDLGNMFDFNKK
jgi:hypothetical protein